MLQMLNPSSRAKVRTKMARARAEWKWELGKAKARKNWWQFRMKPKTTSNQGMITSIVGGAAGLLAIYAVASAIRRRNGAALARSGKGAKRSLRQLASEPAAESLLQPLKRMLAKA